MNLMLRARTLRGVTRDITVWEAHYGQRPNVGELLLGPFGCLAYLFLTKETRKRKVCRLIGVQGQFQGYM